MRTFFHLVQYILQFIGCGHNLEDTAKVGGHEDIFSSCSVFFPVQSAVVTISRIRSRLEVTRTSFHVVQHIL
jgi:hypothetical protein